MQLPYFVFGVGAGFLVGFILTTILTSRQYTKALKKTNEVTALLTEASHKLREADALYECAERHMAAVAKYAPVAQLDRAPDYESGPSGSSAKPS